MATPRRRHISKAIASLCVVFLCCVEPSVAQWEVVSAGEETLWSGIEFIDDSVGIAVGTGMIARTADGGLTWTVVDSTTFDGIQFRDVVCDTAVVGSVCLAVGSELAIGRSVDEGRTWNLVNREFSATLTGVILIDSLSFTAVGIGGWVANSNNTGLTWDSHLIFPQADLYDVISGPDGLLWAAGFSVDALGSCCGVILKSSDQGGTWEVVHTIQSNSEGRIVAIHFFDDQEAVALTSGGVFVQRSGFWRSTDGGVTWERQGTYPSLLAMDFIGDTAGMMVGEQGAIYWSDDRGVTWQQQETLILATYNDVILVDENTALAVAGGLIVRNGAVSTTENEDDQVPESRFSHWAYPNPVAGEVTIAFEDDALRHAGGSTVRIFDVLGRLQRTESRQITSSGRNSLSIATNAMSPGLYFYTIDQHGLKATGSFVVSR